MALVPTTSLFHGASGRIGDVVFRTRNGRTYMCALPVHRKRKPSQAQLEHRQRFAEMTKANRKKQ